MKIKFAIFGRNARRIGFLGLGASSLLAPARVMGGVTLAAAGIWTVVNFHHGSGGTGNSVSRAKPASSGHELHQLQKRHGAASLEAGGAKLLMTAKLSPSNHSKNGNQTSGRPASGFQATGFEPLTDGS